MQTECSAEPSVFGQVERRPVVAAFDGGALKLSPSGLSSASRAPRDTIVRPTDSSLNCAATSSLLQVRVDSATSRSGFLSSTRNQR